MVEPFLSYCSAQPGLNDFQGREGSLSLTARCGRLRYILMRTFMLEHTVCKFDSV